MINLQNKNIEIKILILNSIKIIQFTNKMSNQLLIKSFSLRGELILIGELSLDDEFILVIDFILFGEFSFY